MFKAEYYIYCDERWDIILLVTLASPWLMDEDNAVAYSLFDSR